MGAMHDLPRARFYRLQCLRKYGKNLLHELWRQWLAVAFQRSRNLRHMLRFRPPGLRFLRRLSTLLKL